MMAMVIEGLWNTKRIRYFGSNFQRQTDRLRREASRLKRAANEEGEGHNANMIFELY